MTSRCALPALIAGVLGAVCAPLAAPVLAQMPEETLVSANAYSSPVRTRRLLSRLEFADAFAALDAERAAAAPHLAREWRKHRNGPGDVLAARYGVALLFTDPAAAIPLLQEAAASGAAEIGPYTADEMKAGIALARAESAGDRAFDATLLATLEARDGAEAPNADTEIIARAWWRLALNAAREARLHEARPLAARAERAITASLGDNPVALANAAMLRGVIELFETEIPPLETVEAAEAHFLRAANFFPPQQDVRTFDPVAGKAATWMFVAQSVRVKLGYLRSPEPTEAELGRLWRDDTPTWQRCGLKWKKVKAGEYPRKARKNNDIGFVLVGYDLNEKLRPINVRILGEAPDDYFAELALDAVKDGKVQRRNPARPFDSACRRNRASGWRFEPDQKPFRRPSAG